MANFKECSLTILEAMAKVQSINSAHLVNREIWSLIWVSIAEGNKKYLEIVNF